MAEITNIDRTEEQEAVVRKKLADGFYSVFFEAQTPKSNDFPYGIVKGDDLDKKLKVTADNWADVIAPAIHIGASGAVEDIDITKFVKVDGDKMKGQLDAKYGLVIGHNNIQIAKTFIRADNTVGFEMSSDLIINKDGLIISNHKPFRRVELEEKLYIHDKNIDITGTTNFNGRVNFGSLSIENGEIKSDKNTYYHSGNSNKDDVNWTAKDITSKGEASLNTLTVSGKSTLKDGLVISNGVQNVATFDKNVTISVPTYLSSFFLDNKKVMFFNGEDLNIVSPNGKMTLGSLDKSPIHLASNLMTWNGSSTIITPSGSGNFKMGLKAGHDGIDSVIETYKKDNADFGVLFDGKIRFKGSTDVSLQGDDGTLTFNVDNSNIKLVAQKSQVNGFKDKNEALISSNLDLIHFATPLATTRYVIEQSDVVLSKDGLRLNSKNLIESVNNEVVIHGNIRVKDNISTPDFVSGYSGKGWGIIYNPNTALNTMTVDNLRVRNTLSIYELEIQKISATNGSLWVTNSFSADNVIEI